MSTRKTTRKKKTAEKAPPPTVEKAVARVEEAVESATADMDLGGIDFEDSPEDLAATAAVKITDEQLNRANQEAAKRAINAMQHQPLPKVPQPRPRAPSPEEKEALERELAPKRMRVVETTRLAHGASTYTLRAGKVLDANQYDLDGLRAQGVKLEEIQR